MRIFTKKVLIYIVISIPVLIYCIYVGAFIENLPFADDFDAIIEPVNFLSSQPFDVTLFFKNIFSQDDERRHMLLRTLSFLTLKINGHIDFRVLIIAGLSSYLFLFILVRQGLKFDNFSNSEKWLIPISFILFAPINSNAVFWSMIPIQHISVYIWCFVSIWFLLRRNTYDIFVAIFFGILAICCDVSGNLILYVGLSIMLLQKRFKEIALWGLTVGLLSFFYFKGLVIPEFRPSFSENIENWKQMLIIIVAMPGMIVDIFPSLNQDLRILAAGIFGFLVLGFVSFQFYLFVKEIKKSGFENISRITLWIWGCIAILMGTFLLFAFGRAADSAKSILLNRYKHLFIFWTIFVFLLYLNTRKTRGNSKLQWVLISSLSIFFWINAYFQNLVATDYFRKTIMTDVYNWDKNRSFPSTPIYLHPPLKKRIDKIISTALNNKVIELPNFEFDGAVRVNSDHYIDIKTIQDKENLIVQVLSKIDRAINPTDGIYILIRSGGFTHVLPTISHRNSLRQFILSGNYYRGDATSVQFSKNFLNQTKPYDIDVLSLNKNGGTIYQTIEK